MKKNRKGKDIRLTRAIAPYHPECCTALRAQLCEGISKIAAQYEVRRTGHVNLTVLPICTCPDQAALIARAHLRGLDREHTLAIYLNNQSRVIGFETVAIGAESKCAMTKTSIFRGAILAGATALILAHNHPGGNVAPSSEDKEFLVEVKAAGNVVDCPLVDFLIVSDGEKYSNMTSIEEGKDYA